MLAHPFRGKEGWDDGRQCFLKSNQNPKSLSSLSSLRSRNRSLHALRSPVAGLVSLSLSLSLSLEICARDLSHTKADGRCFVYCIFFATAKNTATRARRFSSPYELRSLYGWTYAKISRRRQVFLDLTDGISERLLAGCYSRPPATSKSTYASARNQFWTVTVTYCFHRQGKAIFPR